MAISGNPKNLNDPKVWPCVSTDHIALQCHPVRFQRSMPSSFALPLGILCSHNLDLNRGRSMRNVMERPEKSGDVCFNRRSQKWTPPVLGSFIGRSGCVASTVAGDQWTWVFMYPIVGQHGCRKEDINCIQTC